MGLNGAAPAIQLRWVIDDGPLEHLAQVVGPTSAQRWPHPAYGKQGWVSVVNPGQACTPAGSELLRLALERARQRGGG